MPFELRVALRYLLAQRRQLFISVISTISTLGVVVGVMILLIALAILTGFQGELRSRILGAASHLSIYREGGHPFDDYRRVVQVLDEIDGIEGATPVLYGKALVSSATGSGLVTLKEDLRRLPTDKLQGKTRAELARLTEGIHHEAQALLAGRNHAGELDSTFGLSRAELDGGRGVDAVLSLVRADEKLVSAALGPNPARAFLDRVRELLERN